jgi:hypothetical protein
MRLAALRGCAAGLCKRRYDLRVMSASVMLPCTCVRVGVTPCMLAGFEDFSPRAQGVLPMPARVVQCAAMRKEPCAAAMLSVCATFQRSLCQGTRRSCSMAMTCNHLGIYRKRQRQLSAPTPALTGLRQCPPDPLPQSTAPCNVNALSSGACAAKRQSCALALMHVVADAQSGFE